MFSIFAYKYIKAWQSLNNFQKNKSHEGELPGVIGYGQRKKRRDQKAF